MLNKNKKNPKQLARHKRHLRIRKKIIGTYYRPRLCVFKSNLNFYAQVIDDRNKLQFVVTLHYNWTKSKKII